MTVTAVSQRPTYANRYARRSYGRRRKSYTKRFAWARPSAARNKRMAYSNRKKINKLAHKVRRTRTYADYLNAGSVVATAGFFCSRLHSYGSWGTHLRISENIQTAKKVHWDSIKLYFSTYLQGSKPVAINIFVVTPTQAYANRDFTIHPVVYSEYSASGDGQCVQLNKDVFRVICQKQYTISNTSLMTGATDLTNMSVTGNANTTWARWSTSFKTNFDIKSPMGEMVDGLYTSKPWTDVIPSQIPYYRKFYQLVYIGGAGATEGATLFWHHQMQVSKVD